MSRKSKALRHKALSYHGAQQGVNEMIDIIFVAIVSLIGIAQIVTAIMLVIDGE